MTHERADSALGAAHLDVDLLGDLVEISVHTRETQRLLRQNRAGWTD